MMPRGAKAVLDLLQEGTAPGRTRPLLKICQSGDGKGFPSIKKREVATKKSSRAEANLPWGKQHPGQGECNEVLTVLPVIDKRENARKKVTHASDMKEGYHGIT